MINSYNNENITNLDYSSIKFIFAQAYQEYYYMYGVNSIEDLSIIPKTELLHLLENELECNNYNDLTYILDRNLPLFFDNNTKKISKFNMTNPMPSKEDIKNKINQEIKDSVLIKQPSFNEKHSNLFGSSYLPNISISLQDIYKKPH